MTDAQTAAAPVDDGPDLGFCLGVLIGATGTLFVAGTALVLFGVRLPF